MVVAPRKSCYACPCSSRPTLRGTAAPYDHQWFEAALGGAAHARHTSTVPTTSAYSRKTPACAFCGERITGNREDIFCMNSPAPNLSSLLLKSTPQPTSPLSKLLQCLYNSRFPPYTPPSPNLYRTYTPRVNTACIPSNSHRSFSSSFPPLHI